MGKNANQIATFADLHSIGYRVPSGKETSTECVTYNDLRNMDQKYNPSSSMVNVFVDRSYYNGYQDLQLDTSTSELTEFSEAFKTKTTLIISEGEKSKLIGTFNIPSGTGTVYFPSAEIYIKLYPQSGYSYSNFNFYVRLRIQDQANNTIWSQLGINIAGTSNVDYSQGKSVSFSIPESTLL